MNSNDPHSHPHPHSHTHSHTESHSHLDGLEVHAHRPRSPLKTELVTHLPLSAAGAAMGLVFAGLICFLAPEPVETPGAGGPTVVHESAAMAADHDHGHDHDHDHAAESAQVGAQPDAHAGHHHEGQFRPLFHLFHPLHMLFSATATTAMFWRYDRRLIRAIVVGLIGSIGVCGASDILLPHLSLLMLGRHAELHICVIEHPGMVLPFAAMGIAVGLLAAIGVARSTLFSHSLHVFISTMASVFYMVNAYGRLAWIDQLGWIFVFLIIAVVGPCCFSDIVFPVAMSKSAREQHAQAECCH